jgi:hypothetical protein
MKDNVKRGALVLVLLALAAGGAFAQMSVGGGVYLASDFGGGVKVKVSGFDATQKYPYFGVGAFGFFEPFPYLDVSAGFFYGFGTIETSGGGTSVKIDGTYSALDIGVTGKFPIAVSDALSVYPALSIVFRSFTTMEAKGNTYDASDMSAFWASLGGGLDYSLDEKLYIRVNLLYGARLSSSLEDKLIKAYGGTGETMLGHGLTFRAGVGYRL